MSGLSFSSLYTATAPTGTPESVSAASDGDLLSRFAHERSQAAFAEFVRRHIALVYSAALRRSGGNTYRAEDIVQTVFTVAAREASKLARHPAPTAWLHTATRNTAINVAIAEQRRRTREKEAMHQFQVSDSATPEWNDIRLVLDGAIDALNEPDRVAVVLRYFEQRSFAEIGAVLNLSENSARMRTERALEKLRFGLAQRGIRSTAVALGATLARRSISAPPAHLAAVIAGAVLRDVVGTSVVGLTTLPRPWWCIRAPLVVALSSVALMTATYFVLSAPEQSATKMSPRALHVTSERHASSTSGVDPTTADRGAASPGPGNSSTAAGASPLLPPVIRQSASRLSAAEILKRMEDTYGTLHSYEDTGEAIYRPSSAAPVTVVSFHLFYVRPGKFRFDSTRQLKVGRDEPTPWISVISDGSQSVFYPGYGSYSQFVNWLPCIESNVELTNGAAFHLPRLLRPTDFSRIHVSLAELTNPRLVGELDFENTRCFVIEGNAPNESPYTLWIGRDDFLLRRVMTNAPIGVFKTTRRYGVRGTVEEYHRAIRVDSAPPSAVFELPPAANVTPVGMPPGDKPR